ncbi:general secretion pathway protein GspI [Bdellovibrio bacteriovorus]|uniref:General secretion pathway protein GspI n=2 Tax=Pseudobdellovibrionaceae TaxID=213483 RepID=A0A150WC48_BDEBC|nr:general secretion pathway protein GspI [Bdellovibrio bacteriovorus]
MALVILSSGLLLLANSWSGSFMRVRKTQLSTEVSALLERKMVEVEMEYQGKPLDSIPEEKEDDFGSEYPQYSWRMTSKEFEVPDFSATLTAQAGGADELTLTIMKTLAEHLGKSIKEVKVTVIYKGAKKPLEFSATQYFVDYDKQLPLPSIPGAGG